MLYTAILIGHYGVKRTIVDDTRAAREITGTVVALSAKRITKWHFIFEAFNRTGQLVRPPCYPLVIFGYCAVLPIYLSGRKLLWVFLRQIWKI